MTANAEVLAIGDELVRGITADTNGAWIAARLTASGIAVSRITVLPDDVKTVSAELTAALGRGARLVVTTGGLGPTADDRTLEAVAAATGRPLADHREALDLVASRYAALARAGVLGSGELTAERRKMARLPEGAEALPNAVGTAPGVALRLADRAVVCLPGVPPEMRAIWDGSVASIVATLFRSAAQARTEVLVGCGDESSLAPALAEVAGRHPAVYVKSHAAEFVASGRLRVSLVASGADAGGATAALDAACADLRRALAARGWSVDG